MLAMSWTSRSLAAFWRHAERNTDSRVCGALTPGSMNASVQRGLRLNMANNPKKVKDPTEVALSAIQEALNINDAAPDSSRGVVGDDVPPPPVNPTTSSLNEPSFEVRPNTDGSAFESIDGIRQT